MDSFYIATIARTTSDGVYVGIRFSADERLPPLWNNPDYDYSATVSDGKAAFLWLRDRIYTLSGDRQNSMPENWLMVLPRSLRRFQDSLFLPSQSNLKQQIE